MRYSVQLLCSALVAALAASCGGPAQRLETHAADLADARAVARDFYDAYGERLGMRDAPFVTIGIESGPGFAYQADHNVLFVTPYREADFDTQRLFERACERGRAEEVYDQLLFRFFTAHELMHLAYERLPRAESLSDYDRETQVSVLTWLFLERTGRTPDDLGEQLAALRALSDDVGRRFPGVRSGEDTPATLLVDDNASYWYVTANSILDAHRAARRAGSPRAYAARLAAGDSAVVAPAEADL